MDEQGNTMTTERKHLSALSQKCEAGTADQLAQGRNELEKRMEELVRGKH